MDPRRYPAFVIHDLRTDEIYRFDQSREITAEAIGKFIGGFERSVSGGQEVWYFF